ncbi:AMP-binding protein [Streptomyces sp. DT203]|uniref:AMP-binding protein n=1 Tax=Streptomyces sp. DT203 TaxID=3393424 RepID=UPI003CEB8577
MDARTVSELLRERTRERPDSIGYTYLSDGEAERETLSYADLDRRASAIAASLHTAGVEPGERALLLLAPGLDYVSAFFGCLYAGVVAVPCYPPDPFRRERTLPRLIGVVGDADPVIALTTSDLLGFIDDLGEHAPQLRKLRWIAVDAVSAETSAPVAVDPGSTAFLQYTSGSTAAPRGVMVSHANLLHNLGMIQRYFGTDSDSQALIWLPPYHDMGLIGGLLQPLYSGCPVTLLSPLHFLEQPMRWLRKISSLGVSVSGGPNFAYELCARRATPQEVAQLDLSSWKVAFNGAEPTRPETLDRFAAVFGPAGFRADAFLACYGLAEATLIVSGTERGKPVPRVHVDRDALAGNTAASGAGSDVSLVSCGSGPADQEIAIVDAGTGQRCPEGVVGEIWVTGPSVARGYWRRPEETERVFGARIEGEDADYLRTGDLGFQLEGRLVVTGRRKDLLIVRGRNHYPHDIEFTAEHAHPALRVGCSAAFQMPDGSTEERLVLVMEVRGAAEAVDGVEITARVREAVALVHGLRAHTIMLVGRGTVPKTSSGKVQRSLCRARHLAGELTEIAPRVPAARAPAADALPGSRDDVEYRLRALVAQLVGVAPDTLDVQVPLLAIGLDSLALVTLQHRLEAEFGVTVPLGDVLAGGAMEGILEQIIDGGSPRVPGTVEAGAHWNGAPSPAVDAAGRIQAPLSHGAREIWLMQQLEPDNPEFTVATALRLPESVDLDALQRALGAVSARHPMLRTTFEVLDEELVQVVHPERPVTVEVHDVPELDERALTAHLTAVSSTPMDLVTGPLLHVGLYRSSSADVLLVRMHHIITDFWSSALLAREVGAFYSAYAAGRELSLTLPRATYLDVSAWRNAVLSDHARVGRMERHWLDQLSVDAGAAWPRLTFPAGDGSGADGGAIEFALSAELTKSLRTRAAAENVTVYVLLLASFMAVLYRTTAQHDLVVGTPMAGRTRPEFADVVGCCAGTSLIRCRVVGDMPFSALLARVRQQVIGALEHQDYSMSLLRERHGVGGRGHLVDVLFTVNQAPPRPTGTPGDQGPEAPQPPSTAHHTDELAALAQVGPAAVRSRLGSLPVERFPLPVGGGAVPVEIVIAEVSGAAHGLLRFRAGSVDAAVAGRMVQDYLAVLDRVAADPDVTLAGLGDAVA